LGLKRVPTRYGYTNVSARGRLRGAGLPNVNF